MKLLPVEMTFDLVSSTLLFLAGVKTQGKTYVSSRQQVRIKAKKAQDLATKETFPLS